MRLLTHLISSSQGTCPHVPAFALCCFVIEIIKKGKVLLYFQVFGFHMTNIIAGDYIIGQIYSHKPITDTYEIISVFYTSAGSHVVCL